MAPFAESATAHTTAPAWNDDETRFHAAHDRIHAHLAAVLLYSANGADRAVKLELKSCRSELMSHLRHVERFVLERLAGQDVFGDFGWHHDIGHLNEALLMVEFLAAPQATLDFYRAVSRFREALRFHCHIEESLLRLAHTEPATTPSGVRS